MSLVVFDLKIFPCMHTLIRITYPLGGGEGRLRDAVHGVMLGGRKVDTVVSHH